MLYDPKWEQQTDKVFGKVSLRAFIGWLEQQPVDGQYDFIWPEKCALAQHLQSLGYSENDSVVNFPVTEINWLEEIVLERPHTFGAVLGRARAALNK